MVYLGETSRKMLVLCMLNRKGISDMAQCKGFQIIVFPVQGLTDYLMCLPCNALTKNPFSLVKLCLSLPDI